MIPREPDIHQHPDDYHLSSRKRQHRIHYSRIKSAAIAASYRLMHVSTDNVLVRKTANAAVNGMRPQYVKAAKEHKQQVEPDVIDDAMYNHKSTIEPITALCLVKEPRRNRDDFKPPSGYEFVLLSTLDQENRRKPILCGSGEKYYLCFRRRTAAHERAITDIQITFKSTIPLGYQPLNYLFDGTQLPYFQRKEETEQKQNEQSNNNGNNNNNNNNNNNEQQNNNNNENGNNIKGNNNNVNNNKNESQNNNNSNNNNDSNDPNTNEQKNDGIENKEEEVLSFDNIPLIIFSKIGESHIIDVQLKELGTKLREGLISVDRSLDDNVANLNKGTADTTIHPIYISYANDLISYRFSPNELNRHINLKFLTPLLISLHLRKSDLAMTAIDSLKYLLLSNFIRFRDSDLMTTTLKKICSAVSHSVVTWNTSYHDKLMEIQIIIFQKFIHHLPPTCLYEMLVSSLIPLKYDLPKKFLKKYIETSFSYIRILEFGDSLDETGNIKKTNNNQYNNKAAPPIPYMNGSNSSNQNVLHITKGGGGGHNTNNSNSGGGYKFDDNEPEEFKYQFTIFNQMKNYLTNDIITEAVDYSTAERILTKFYQIDLYSKQASILIGECCASLFKNDRDKPWKPLGVMIIFLCRIALCDRSKTNNRLDIRSCRYCTRLLEKIIDTSCDVQYINRMPSSFKYLLRRTISRLICLNLCNYNISDINDSLEDIFNANLRFFEKICLNWYKFFQHEIGIILTEIILPQVLERFTPFRRRQKFLSCISRILLSEQTLIDLIYSLDIINGKRIIHSIVDSLIGILNETAAILKHDKPTFEIADQSSKSYTNNYNFHHLAIQCLTFLCKSYSTWFNREIIRKNWSSSYLSQCVMDASYNGIIESKWQLLISKEKINLEAKDIACKIDDDKAIKHAVKKLLSEKIISNTSISIVEWIHSHRYDIPASNIGDYIGGSRPKKEKPFEEEVRIHYIKQCNLNFNDYIELVVHYFLTKCGFRLPPEAQKIERILESFAICYYYARREIWENSDAVFVVLNAILMLNTSLHNPRIKEKDKIKRSVFLGMCLGVKGQSLNSADYERVYNYIEKNAYEIKFEDEAIAANTKRQFDEWKKKNILNSRRPIHAYTQELKKEIKLMYKSKSNSSKMHIGVPNNSNNNNKHTINNNTVNTPDFFNDNTSTVDDYYGKVVTMTSVTAGGGAWSIDENNVDDVDDIKDNNNVEKRVNELLAQEQQEEEDDDDDDDKLIDDEQKEIEAEMKKKFQQHSIASIKQDEKEYLRFCLEIEQTGLWSLRNISYKLSNLITINSENNNNLIVELGCLLIDNWWSRILDALKIVFELNDDPYTTPLVLSILPHFLQITLTLGAFGHEQCKIAFNGILYRYKVWWLQAILRMDEDTKSKNPNMAKESDLQLIEKKIWEKPQKYYEKLKTYILASQHIVHNRTIWLRLRDLQFEFSDVHFMLKGREFIGEQTILKMGARDTTYRLFFFNDMLLYANGRPGKYRSHRVLLLIFCALEDLKNSRNVTNAFRIHSPQKSITIALPNLEYKKICFKKINELIVKQRKKIRQLIQELYRKHKQNVNTIGDKYIKFAEKFQNSSAFLHQNINYIDNNKNPLPNNCKLCLTAFNRMGRRKKECPICNDYVCPKCIQRKARNPKTSKRRNVCDGCLDIVEGRLRL